LQALRNSGGFFVLVIVSQGRLIAILSAFRRKAKYNAEAIALSPFMKVREIIKLLEEDGWYLARTKGSHRQFKHSVKTGLATVPGKLSDDLAPGTLKSILRQAKLIEDPEQEEPE
jgi:predicted RNA binding protein YcfA (HicA-like mRNA interferase family)